jgi:hypothetical protein
MLTFIDEISYIATSVIHQMVSVCSRAIHVVKSSVRPCAQFRCQFPAGSLRYPENSAAGGAVISSQDTDTKTTFAIESAISTKRNAFFP